MAPSLDSLQDMLKTCEEFAEEYGLQFSTDPNPKKCKTKCIAYLKNERPLRKLQLCGNNLPWVDAGKHVGNNIGNVMDGMKKDMRIKRAKYIDKNNELCQEFYFAHPKSKLQANTIYNMHFTGSPLWDLFCREAEMIENTYNSSVRIMCNLPRETHRFYIEPLTDSKHIKNILIKRFLSFIEQVKRSTKVIPKQIMKIVKHDSLSVTGSNLRNIMILLEKDTIEEISITDVDNIVYSAALEENMWKIDCVKELLDVIHGDTALENFSIKEVQAMIEDLCVN